MFYWAIHTKNLALQTNRNVIPVSATTLRAGLYCSIKIVKQLVAGVCDSDTGEHWHMDHPHSTNHHSRGFPIRSLSRAGDKRVAQDKPHGDQKCFQEVNIFFSGALFENTEYKYGWGYNGMLNKGFLVFLKNFLRH